MASDERIQGRLDKKKLEATLAANPCGTCTACCTVKDIPELNKAEATPCTHLVPAEPEVNVRGGCSIYTKRPESCRDFFCAFRFGLLSPKNNPVSLRPDKFGIMFEIPDTGPKGILLITAREVWAGAIAENMTTLHEIVARGMVIYLIEGERRRYLGPEELVRVCVMHARRKLPLHVPRD